MGHGTERAVATRITVSVFGVVAGLAGIEHGIGEVLQGNAAPGGIVIQSWPDSAAFAILDGEPAMTLVPNLLVTGVLAVVVSLAFLVWAALFVESRHGGLVMALLSLLMLLVGGGFGPPVLGLLLAAAAIRIDAPPRRARPFGRPWRLLAKAWPWCFGVAGIAWLSLLPGTVLLDLYFGVDEPDAVPLIGFTVLFAFGSLLLTILAGFTRDARRRAGVNQTSLEKG